MGMYRLVDLVDHLKAGRDGEEKRIQVDQASTGFYAGREFRMFSRISLNNGQSSVIKAVVPVNVVLISLSLQLVGGWVEVETRAGGTEGGTFGTAVPVFPANNMTERPQPAYAGQVALSSGGTHTGGVVLDVIMSKTSGTTNLASSVGSSAGDERGIAAGTYYFVIAALSDSTGVIKARWEERPPGSQGAIDYGD